MQYFGTGDLIGWWVLLPLPFVVAGETVWAGQRRRRSAADDTESSVPRDRRQG